MGLNIKFFIFGNNVTDDLNEILGVGGIPSRGQHVKGGNRELQAVLLQVSLLITGVTGKLKVIVLTFGLVLHACNNIFSER
jgi:hypothetical protein